jgi:hypothetical protein
MEIEKLISALEETISYLRKSDSSDWAPMPVEELIRKLEAEITKAETSIDKDGRQNSAYFGNCR